VARLTMRDVTRAGRELQRAELDDLPASLTVAELLEARVRTDVARYNADPGPVYVGLVQPADAIRHRDGHHLRDPRPLDADRFVAAAREAVATGILAIVVGGNAVQDLDTEVVVADHDEVVALLGRGVVARDG
jgi:hypothetical protein